MPDPSNPSPTPHDNELAQRVRAACLRAFEAAYHDAGVRGLCPEGRIEAATQAVKSLDLSAALSLPAEPDRA